MTDQKKLEKRKYPRFDSNLEIIFYDKNKTRGKLVNISKKGSLLTTESGLMRALKSLITFRVFFEGVGALSESTTPEISLKNSSANKDNYPNSVKILGQVVRHVRHKNEMGMGIQLLDLDGNDLIKWNSFLLKIGKEQIVLPYTGPKESAVVRVDPKPETFTIRFKSLKDAICYLPQNSKVFFFIPLSTPRKKGVIIKISLVHPESQAVLSFNGIVDNYGPNPKDEKMNGIFFRYEDLSTSLKHQINIFLNHKHFQ